MSRAHDHACMTHGRPAETARGAARARRDWRPRTAPCSRSTPTRPTKHAPALGHRGRRARRCAGRRATSSCASRSAATARSCARCAPTRARRCRCSRVNFGEVGFLATVEPDRMREGFERALAGTLDVLQPAGDRDRRPGRARTSRSTTSRVHRKVGGRVAELVLRGRRRGGRQRALRRAGRRHAGRLDRLQPRQRRAGDGLGRGRHGRVVHRAALAERARARDRARRRADAPQQLARGARRLGRRPPGRRARAGAALRARFADDVATLAQMEGSSFYRRLREKFGAPRARAGPGLAMLRGPHARVPSPRAARPL